jgi:simple sugar transport system substrate-binding protein/ribose transport system substrate-binding protein
MSGVLRRAGAVVLIAGAAALIAACGSDSSSGGDKATESGGGAKNQVVMGMSFCYLNNSGMVAFRDAEKKAAEARGWKVLQPTDAGNSQATQLTQINDLLTQGATVLDLHQCTAEGVVPAIQKANEKGVVVFTPDQVAAGGKVAVAATVDNVGAAEQGCEHMLEVLGSTSGKVIQLQGDIGSDAGRQRTEGFEKCMKAKAPSMKILTVATKWDAAAGAAGLKTLLNGNPDVKAVFFQSDIVFSTAAIQALKSIDKLTPVGQPGHILLWGIDGGAEMLDFIRNGEADFTVSQPLSAYGKVALPFVQAALDGKLAAIKPRTTSTLSGSEGMQIKSVETGLMVVVPATLVTEDNVESKDLWANQVSG